MTNVYRIYAYETGDWGPDELYGDTLRVYLDDADCRAAVHDLTEAIDESYPAGCAYAADTIDVTLLTPDEAQDIRPRASDPDHGRCRAEGLAYAEWSDSRIEALESALAEVASLRGPENAQRVAEIIRPLLGERASSNAYRGVVDVDDNDGDSSEVDWS